MKTFILILASLPSLSLAQSGQGQWQKIKLDSFFYAYNVSFVDSEVGYVVGQSTKGANYDELFRTSDGGQTWREIDPSSSDGRVEGGNYSFPTRTTIFNGGQNLCSFDSGVTWVERSYPSNGSTYNWNMFSATTGYGDGVQGKLMKTEDSAKSWFEVLHYMEYFQWTDSLHGIAGLTDTEDGRGIAHPISGFYSWSTTDGGQKWTFHSTQLADTPRWSFSTAAVNSPAIYFYRGDLENGMSVIVNPHSYYWTTDLGTSWDEDTSFAGRVATLSAIGNVVWVAISSADTLTPSHPSEWLAQSYDGIHWNIDSESAKSLNVNSITFTDARHGWAVGNDTITAGEPLSDSTVAYILKYIGPPLSLGVAPRAEPRALPALELSPNPAGNALHFQLGQGESILRCEVVNALGGTTECPLASVTGNGGEVDISSLAPGMYELCLWTRAGRVGGSFIKSP